LCIVVRACPSLCRPLLPFSVPSSSLLLYIPCPIFHYLISSSVSRSILCSPCEHPTGLDQGDRLGRYRRCHLEAVPLLMDPAARGLVSTTTMTRLIYVMALKGLPILALTHTHSLFVSHTHTNSIFVLTLSLSPSLPLTPSRLFIRTLTPNLRFSISLTFSTLLTLLIFSHTPSYILGTRRSTDSAPLRSRSARRSSLPGWPW
jgi:hypothetical protein